MPYIGEIAAVITALLWSATSIAFTEASRKVGSLVVNITRLIFAAIFLFVTIALFGFDIKLSFEQIVALVLSGLVGFVFGDAFLFRAYKEIGARLSMLIMALVPALSSLLAFIFLGEKISLLVIIGIAITTLGVALVVMQKDDQPSGSVNKIGIIFGIFGAIGQAVGMIFAKQAFNLGEINGFVATLARIIPSIIILYPITFFIRTARNPFRILFANKRGLVFTLVGSVVGPFLGVTFSLIAVANTYVGIASTLMATVPIIMLPITKYYYKEKLSAYSIAGAFIAVGGVAILFLN